MAKIILNGKYGSYEFDSQGNTVPGGTGKVFKGKVIASLSADIQANSFVAIKVLYRDLAEDIMNIIRDENATKIKVNHPNLLRIYEFIEVKGRYHTISEWLDGETLDRRIRLLKEKGSRLPQHEINLILEGLFNSIECLHQQPSPIYHRDIKPGNIMLCTDGSIKLIDYGVAKIQKDTSEYNTVIGSVLGTPNYAAPEQIKGQHDRINASSDVYALGNTIYELFTGSPPFEGAQFEVMDKQVNSPLPKEVEQIPEPFQKVVRISTQKEQLQRYQSIGEMRKDLVEIHPEENKDSTVQPIFSFNFSLENGKEWIANSFWIIVLWMGIGLIIMTYQALKPEFGTDPNLSTQEKVQFETLKKEGDKLFINGELGKACEKYKAAQLIWPDPGLQRKILESCKTSH